MSLDSMGERRSAGSADARPPFRYAANGLTLSSDLALPELASDARGRRVADVRIQLAKAGAVAEAPALALDLPQARYVIHGSDRIVVAPRPGAGPGEVRLGLLGPAMAALLHRRGALPLHAMAFARDGAAFLVAGPSGSGKSTLAAQLQALGAQVLCDDLCAIRLDDAGSPRVWPGAARIKLWPDSLAALGLEGQGLPRVAEGADKRSVAIVDPHASTPSPVRCLYVLSPDRDGARGRPWADRLGGARAAGAVVSSLYRWPLASLAGEAGGAFAGAVRLASACAVYAIRPVASFADLAPEALALLRHARAATRRRLVP